MSQPGVFRADLPDLARKLALSGPHKIHRTSRRVRAILNHAIIVDTTAAVHVWEHGGYPQFYIPVMELRGCTWRDKEEISEEGSSVRASVIEITVPGAGGLEDIITDRALRFWDAEIPGGPLAGLVRLEFGAMDQWLEEDSPIYVHPKDPFKRIDILPSSRPVEVKVQGVTVAKASSSAHLLETGLPTRYYLPLTAVDPSVLRKSDLVTKCPYKGDAEYYHVVVNGEEFKNLVWYYRIPTHESAGIAGLLCFYNEKVDIILDGEPLERPQTHFG